MEEEEIEDQWIELNQNFQNVILKLIEVIFVVDIWFLL